jgi:hypothetical protein
MPRSRMNATNYTSAPPYAFNVCKRKTLLLCLNETYLTYASCIPYQNRLTPGYTRRKYLSCNDVACGIIFHTKYANKFLCSSTNFSDETVFINVIKNKKLS